MKLDKERTGWGLSVRTNLPEALLKEKMNLAAECMRDIFVPLRRCAGGGSVYVLYQPQAVFEGIYQ